MSMSDEKEFCSKHNICEMKIDNIEKKISDLEKNIGNQVNKLKDEWDENWKSYKQFYNQKLDELKNDTQREIESVKNNASSLENVVNSLTLTVTKLEMTIDTLSKNLESFINEFKENKRDTKTALIYPILVTIIGIIAGICIGKLIK
jgi:gas vesicle protein